MFKANTWTVITTEREREKGIVNHNNLHQVHAYFGMLQSWTCLYVTLSMVVKLLWAIKYSKPTFNQRTYGIWLSTVNFLYHGEMQLQSSSSTDELQSCGLSTNNKFLRGTPGPSMVVHLLSACFYLFIYFWQQNSTAQQASEGSACKDIIIRNKDK